VPIKDGIHSLLGDYHLAEDAAQEAFIEAHRAKMNDSPTET
jgi:DNA-directed RNA polymerase specialized sigma24 family protein